MTERELFEATLDRPEAERANYLAMACPDDPALMARVAELLARHAAAGSFLENPPPAATPTGEFRPQPGSSSGGFGSVSEAPGEVIGPYKLLQQIGEGGFGCVFMAEQERPVRRKVALKIIKPGMDTAQVIARFESERQALALMDHPNIARVLDAGATASGRPYFVMELVRGVPITEFCDKNHMPAEGRLKLFVDVCHAIQHAHHKGVIHRDVKPSNVMVTLHDGVAVVKVIDFGVAKATVQRLTERTLFTAFGQMIGTPAYMSPEQAEMSGLDIDTRSDVYSLGVLLYELLTGTTPLELQRLRQAGYLEMQRLIREEAAPRPSNRLSSLGDSATLIAGNRGVDPKRLTQLLSGDLDWIVMKSLEKDRNRRYGSPANFADDVRRYLQREAILARPPSTVYQIRKFTQRNRAAVFTAALFTLLLLLGIAGTTFGLIRARQGQAEANEQRERVAEEQVNTQQALEKSRASERDANIARLLAQRQAANSDCDIAQQLCEQNKVATGLFFFGSALKNASEAKAAELEEAIRLNISAWEAELHPLRTTIKTSGSSGRPVAAFRPDGKLIAVAGQNAKVDAVSVRLYRHPDGKALPESVELAGPTRVYQLAWTHDGGTLAVYAGDGNVYLWKPGEPAPRLTIAVDPGGRYGDGAQNPSLAFSPEGSRLVVGTSKPLVRVYDAATGKPTTIELAHEDLHPEWAATPAVDWSRDGTRILTGNHNGVVKIWEAASGKLVRRVVTGRRGLNAARFNPDGTRFVSASGHGIPKLQIWETATGKPAGEPLRHFENLYDAEFSPDGKTLLAIDAGRDAFLWDVGTGRVVGTPIWMGQHPTACGFHPGGAAVWFNESGSIRIHDLEAGINRPEVPRDDPEPARLAPYRERYRKLLSGVDSDGNAFDLTRLALSPDGATLAKYSKDSPLELIDAPSGRLLRTIPGTQTTAEVYWKPDGTEFVTATWSIAKVRDAGTGTAKADLRFYLPFTGAFSPDGTLFAMGSINYNLEMFNTATWRRTGSSFGHTNKLTHSAFSRDGRLVFTSDTTGSTRMWHVASGKRVGPVVEGVAPVVAPDGRGYTTWTGKEVRGYRIPAPNAGTADDTIRQSQSLTGAPSVLDLLAAQESSRNEMPTAIEPDQAREYVGKRVILEMKVASVGMNKLGEWLYLNSEQDYKNPKNVTIAVKFPTPERRRAMGIADDAAQMVGKTVRVGGRMGLYRDAPQLTVERPEQFTELSAEVESP